MAKTIRTPSGKVFRVNADTREGAIAEIFDAGLQREAGFVSGFDLANPGNLLEGPLDAFLVGAGRTFDRAYNAVTRNTEREAEQQRLFDLSQGEQGFARGLGEFAPALATLPISGGIGTAAGVGATIGGLSDVENPLRGAAFGGTGGAVGFKAGQALNAIPGVSRFADDVSEQLRSATQRVRQLGLRLRPTQRNPAAGRAEALLESNLASRGVFEAIDESQQKALNRLAAESIGENTDDVSLAVLERARKRISKSFGEALDGNEVPLELGFKQNVASLSDDILRTPGVNPDTAKVVENAIEQINASPAFIPAERYQAWQSAWRKLASSSWRKGDSQLGEFYSGLAQLADDAASQSVPARNIEMLNNARRQWGNYKRLTRLNTTVNKQTGNVNPRTFSREVGRGAGNEDLAALTDVAAIPRFQNSGTADRLLTNQLLPGGLGASIGAVTSDDPVEGALIGGAAGFAGSRLLAELMARNIGLPQSVLPNLLSRSTAAAVSDQ